MPADQDHPFAGRSPFPFGPAPATPHPATVVQPKPVIGAPAARPPHPATVAQKKPALPTPAAKPPHPATVAQRRPAHSAADRGRPANPSATAQRMLQPVEDRTGGTEIKGIKDLITGLNGKVDAWITQGEENLCFAITTEWIRLNLLRKAETFRQEVRGRFPKRFTDIQSEFAKTILKHKELKQRLSELTEEFNYEPPAISIEDFMAGTVPQRPSRPRRSSEEIGNDVRKLKGDFQSNLKKMLGIDVPKLSRSYAAIQHGGTDKMLEPWVVVDHAPCTKEDPLSGLPSNGGFFLIALEKNGAPGHAIGIILSETGWFVRNLAALFASMPYRFMDPNICECSFEDYSKFWPFFMTYWTAFVVPEYKTFTVYQYA